MKEVEIDGAWQRQECIQNLIRKVGRPKWKTIIKAKHIIV